MREESNLLRNTLKEYLNIIVSNVDCTIQDTEWAIRTLKEELGKLNGIEVHGLKFEDYGIAPYINHVLKVHKPVRQDYSIKELVDFVIEETMYLIELEYIQGKEYIYGMY